MKREGAGVLDGPHILCFPHSFLFDYSVLTQGRSRVQWLTAQMLELEGFDSESQLCNVLVVRLCTLSLTSLRISFLIRRSMLGLAQ